MRIGTERKQSDGDEKLFSVRDLLRWAIGGEKIWTQCVARVYHHADRMLHRESVKYLVSDREQCFNLKLKTFKRFGRARETSKSADSSNRGNSYV